MHSNEKESPLLFLPPGPVPSPSLQAAGDGWASCHLSQVRGRRWKMEQSQRRLRSCTISHHEPPSPSPPPPAPATCSPSAGPGAQGTVLPPPLNCPPESGAPRLLPGPCTILPLPLDLLPTCHRGILKLSSDHGAPATFDGFSFPTWGSHSASWAGSGTGVQIWCLAPTTSCVTLVMLLNVSEPYFPHLRTGNNNIHPKCCEDK